MIHGCKESEVAFVLDYSESEATPLQRIGYGHDMGVYLVDRHVPVIDRHEFDVGRIVDGVPYELSIIGPFEPTAERVVPT